MLWESAGCIQPGLLRFAWCRPWKCEIACAAAAGCQGRGKGMPPLQLHQDFVSDLVYWISRFFRLSNICWRLAFAVFCSGFTSVATKNVW
jgi:hypothetical protein